jgi:hypothetical protein
MAADAARGRDPRPTMFTSLRDDPLARPVADWIRLHLAERLAA